MHRTRSQELQTRRPAGAIPSPFPPPTPAPAWALGPHLASNSTSTWTTVYVSRPPGSHLKRGPGPVQPCRAEGLQRAHQGRASRDQTNELFVCTSHLPATLPLARPGGSWPHAAPRPPTLCSPPDPVCPLPHPGQSEEEQGMWARQGDADSMGVTHLCLFLHPPPRAPTHTTVT